MLVISTMRTPDVVETVQRLVEAYPSHQQQHARHRIVSSLRAVVSQRMVGSCLLA